MSCQWGHEDCTRPDKCYLCMTEDLYYVPPKVKKHIKKAKETGRKGSQFEAMNSNLNNQILIGGSVPTPNSGAGAIKGDEEIKGLINIMEELKEQNQLNSRGEKTFTIHKEWLTKLHNEAKAARKEFWYLKFIFSNQDIGRDEYYAILESSILMRLIKTMWEDRKKANLAQSQIDIANRRKELVEAENVYLKAQIALLEAQLNEKST